MKSSILEKAKSIINQRKTDNIIKANNNKTTALNNKDFKALYQNYISQMIEDSKNGLTDSPKQKELYNLVQAKLNDLKIDFITPNYTCPICQDNGIVNGEYCVCLKKEINKILIAQSGFDKLEDFKNVKFDIFANKALMKLLYEKMQKWCHSNFEKNIVYISGETGVGKTHLIKCMANELINQNYLVSLTTSFAMHQDFIKSYTTRDLEQKNEILDKYLNCDILFIDDLGTELRVPNISISYLYQIINERKMNHKPTIITTNLDLSELKDYYDERISSRIIDKLTSICVCIKGEDLRLKKK